MNALMIASLSFSWGTRAAALCRGRCVFIERGPSIQRRLEKLGQRGLDTLAIDELGIVEATDLSGVRDDCAMRARARSDLTPQRFGVVVDALDLITLSSDRVVRHLDLKTECERVVSTPDPSPALRERATTWLELMLSWVAPIWSSYSR